MAEPVRLVITAEDLASPALQNVKQHLDAVPLSAGQAAQVFSHLGITEETLRQTTDGTAQSWGTMTSSLLQGTRTAEEATGTTALLGGTFGSLATTALGVGAALVGVHSAVQGISTILRETVGVWGSFEAAMNEVYTMGVRSVPVQQQLREEILQLPPVLGSSTELAKGLYQVLSSGVEPAKSVQFLEAAAQLAKAGLANLDTTVEALTKTMHAYHLPAEQATEVSEILFKTVVVGQGRLEQFAHAFPNVTQQSAALGVSLTETAATLAVLSNAFRNPENAATGLRGLFNELTQNAAKFAAVGIDVKQVIAEEGLAGVMRRLGEVTHGSSEAMHEFVPEARAGQAALALLGPEYDNLIQTTEKFRQKTGEIPFALKQISSGFQESWRELVNTTERAAQEIAPPFLQAMTSVVQGVSAAAKAIQTESFWKGMLVGAGDLGIGLSELSKQTGEWRDEGQRAAATAALMTTEHTKTTAEIRAEILAWVGLQQQAVEYRQHVLDLPPSFADVQKAASTLEADLQKLGSKEILPKEMLDRLVTTTTASLQTLSQTGDLTFEQLHHFADKATDAIVKRMGALPPALQTIYSDILARGEADTNELAEAWGRFSIQSQGVLQHFALEATHDFTLVRQSGEGTMQQLQKSWQDVVRSFNAGGATQVSDEFLDNLAAMNRQEELLGQTQSRVLRDMAGNLKVVTDAQLGLKDQTAAFLQWYAGAALITNTRLLDSSKLTYQEIAHNVHDVVQKINAGEFPALSTSYQMALNQMIAQTSAFGRDLVTQYTDAFGNIRVAQGHMVEDVERQFSGFRAQTAQEAQNAASAWMTEFQHMQDSGQYTHTQLAGIARQGTGLMKQAYDELPPEFQHMMDNLGIAADKGTAHITQKFKESAGTIEDYWAGVEAKINKDNASFSGGGGTVNLEGMSLSQLQVQRGQQMLGLQALSGLQVGSDATRAMQLALQQIDAQIAKLLAEQQAKAQGTSLTQTTTQSGSQTVTRTATQTTSTASSSGGVSSLGSSALGSLDSTIKKPSSSSDYGQAVTILPTTSGAGTSSSGTATGGTYAAQSGGTTVHAPITINLSLTSPISRIDGQNLVASITPALQEAIDRNQIRLY